MAKLTRHMTLLMGIIPGRMLPPGFIASCTSSGIRKDSLYQISNSERQKERTRNRAAMGKETRAVFLLASCDVDCSTLTVRQSCCQLKPAACGQVIICCLYMGSGSQTCSVLGESIM